MDLELITHESWYAIKTKWTKSELLQQSFFLSIKTEEFPLV